MSTLVTHLIIIIVTFLNYITHTIFSQVDNLKILYHLRLFNDNQKGATKISSTIPVKPWVKKRVGETGVVAYTKS